MSGIYLHIPFCKQACHYCDFHFSTSLKYKDDLLNALQKELKIRKNYIKGPVETIYFGGGTPSLLSAAEIDRLIDTIHTEMEVISSPEITLEANPDDLNSVKVNELRTTAVNRFSIGIQSFFEEDLLWMNRAHNAAEADSSIKRVQDAGFENITIDLIYGYPLLSDEKWETNISKAVGFDVPHISSYSLTVEDKTALSAFIKKGIQTPLDERQSAAQFEMLMERLAYAGFEHYEISNFAKPGSYSKHNTNYWMGVHYLGIGPSAHSFNGTERQWNIASNSKYLDSIWQGTIPSELEILSNTDRVNEYIMTSLRTIWGMDLKHVEEHFGGDYGEALRKNLHKFLEKNWIIINDNKAVLSTSGKLFSDRVAAELFFEK